MPYATDRKTIDRDEPCSCGCTAGVRLADGAIECPSCNSVQADPWVVAHD